MISGYGIRMPLAFGGLMYKKRADQKRPVCFDKRKPLRGCADAAKRDISADLLKRPEKFQTGGDLQ
jgi:hypothetical protein